jgi:NAD(P)-dependent dehydrogenase (short-subunit alcohol dehydrogenase family)
MGKKIVVVGATGTIGRAVVEELAKRHDVLQAGRSSAPYKVDLTDAASIERLFEEIGPVDAVVCTAGSAHFGPLNAMTIEQFKIGLHDKLLGQVQLALLAAKRLNDAGSITLTTGILSREPVVNGANASTVNAAVDGFVRAAAIELPRGIRINAVSPTVLVESMAIYGAYFLGFEPVPANRVALAYSRSVDGAQTGQVYPVE